MKPYRGFTLIELALVVSLIGIIALLGGMRTGSFVFWREEGFVRRLSETIAFLHRQAVIDQAYYRIDFNLDNSSYSVGVIRPESDLEEGLADMATEAGNLSLELAAFLSPSIKPDHTLIPPPSHPSLAEPVLLPFGAYFEGVKTPRGVKKLGDSEAPYILFSPRGFSEFGVINIVLSNGAPVTILVNPFTGVPEIFREKKDFEWIYGRKGG